MGLSRIDWYQINVNNGLRRLTAEGGRTLLTILTEERIFVPSSCCGRGTCGLCRIKVLRGGGALSEAEKSLLSEADRKNNIRLCCQVRVDGDLEIEMPAKFLSIGVYDAKCIDITPLTRDIKRFRFELIKPGSIDFVPGQYIRFLCPSYDGDRGEVYRPFSLTSDCRKNNIVELIIRRVPDGNCTRYCFDYLKIGDVVMINGPHGDFRLSGTDSPMIFIAGGSGMGPFVSILHQMKNTGSMRKAIFFFGANTIKDMYLVEQMKQFESVLKNFKFVPVVAKPEPSDNWPGQTGLVTEAVKRSLGDLKGYEGYLCGPPGMFDAAIKVLVDLGVSKDKIYFDKFIETKNGQ